jgi:hypothetical protein
MDHEVKGYMVLSRNDYGDLEQHSVVFVKDDYTNALSFYNLLKERKGVFKVKNPTLVAILDSYCVE